MSFNLTLDQKKTLKEIENDLFKKSRMYRLLQGDVGSGKTIVSLLSAANVINSGFQVVLMAPTEILAKQHYEYFCQHMPEYKNKFVYLPGKQNLKRKFIL